MIELKKVLQKRSNELGILTEYGRGFREALDFFYVWLRKNTEQYNLHIKNRELSVENSNLKSDNTVLTNRCDNYKQQVENLNKKIKMYEKIYGKK